ncbi:MAG: hypothetical protein A2289_20970 [Deltaproteobacteria bacterium RIFOXYA12_FULL_58_15]|nr:MAG: hypothetical protein A2289_20970 [Deltaproteobacteria bacterium RIFOXYA12_FULL_58_15]OGR13432.1 MAG: hypothetical protein A2341_07010 [Deltaproteobacteria bacterium RIFOXYB12_FULL_58_9]
MKIYRKVIPKIAKDVVRSLLANRAIEVEDGHRDEAELDVAGVLVGYLNDLDRIATDAKETMVRHNLPVEMTPRIKKTIADTRKIIVGAEALDFVIDRMIKGLFNSKNIEEVFVEDHEIRALVSESMKKYLGVDEELDREVRGRLKNLREGTSEWEVEYNRLIEQMRQRHQQA